MAQISDSSRSFRGLLVGTAVGDSLGLPAEGLSRRRVRKLFRGRWRHRFLLRRGMVSDDTDHTFFVSQSLLAHPDSAARFGRRFAWHLRLWLLTVPAGVGAATLKSILRLWVGVGHERSGVYSAGNGPAMRLAGPGYPCDPSGVGFCSREISWAALALTQRPRLSCSTPGGLHFYLLTFAFRTGRALPPRRPCSPCSPRSCRTWATRSPRAT